MPRVFADLSGDWLGGFSAARNLECSRLDPWCHCGLLELWRRGERAGMTCQGWIWPMAATLFPRLVPVVGGGGARYLNFLKEYLAGLMHR